MSAERTVTWREVLAFLNQVRDAADEPDNLPFYVATNAVLNVIANDEGVSIADVVKQLQAEYGLTIRFGDVEPKTNQAVITMMQAAMDVRHGAWVAAAPSHVFPEFLEALERRGWTVRKLPVYVGDGKDEEA